MGTGHREDQAMVRTLEFSALHPHPPAQDEGLEMELIIDPTDLRKLRKIPAVGFQRAFRLWICTHWEGTSPQVQEDRSSCTWEAPQTSHMCLFIWLHLYPLSYNKLVNTSKCSWILGVTPANPKRGLLEPLIYSQLIRSAHRTRACNWCLRCGSVGGRVSLVGLGP